MKKIEGINLVENIDSPKETNSFRHNALYEVGKFDNFVTVYSTTSNSSFFVNIEPYDFSKNMKAYMPLCPIMAIDKSKKKLLRSIRARLSNEKKIIFDENMKLDSEVMIFCCFSSYIISNKKVTLPENTNFVNISSSEFKSYVSFIMSGVESSLNIIKKDGYESFKDYVERNAVEIVEEVKIDKNSDRYKTLKSLFGDNEEIIKKMYGSGVNQSGSSNDRNY